MILYEETKPREDAAPPAWLDGARDLQRRDGHQRRWWGIGSGVFVGEQPDAKWVPIGGGIKAAILKGFDPSALAIDQQWCPTTFASDLKGRSWVVPCVLSSSGDRQFRTSYGPDFLPALTPEQAKAEAVAKAARAALVASVADNTGLPMQLACRWSAELLATVNHISVDVVAGLGLLDDALVAATLYAASGLTPRLEG
jgi:hypothetical protein